MHYFNFIEISVVSCDVNEPYLGILCTKNILNRISLCTTVLIGCLGKCLISSMANKPFIFIFLVS